MRPPRPVNPEGIETLGLRWRARETHWKAYWLPRQDIAERGYPIRSRLLWPPANDLTATPDWNALKAACNTLQNEMLTWGPIAAGKFDPLSWFDDTVASVIDIYLNDPDSPYKELGYQASLTYADRLELIRAEHGTERIIGSKDHPGLTFRSFKHWHEKWRDPDGANRVSHAYEHIKFTRIAFHFCALAKVPGCKDISEILSEMEFENPKSRTQVVTPEQSILLRKGAHQVGRPSIAFAQALQDGLIVRQKDVIGELIPRSHPGISDTHMGAFKWVKGFRWEELDNNFTLTHRLSKSLRGKRAIANPDSGKTKVWSLWLYPTIIEELCLIAGVARAELRRDMFPASGPMVTAEHTRGLPWRQKVFANKWRKIARLVGIPDEVQNRDTRAGAATDADQKGADVDRKKAASAIRPALGHSKDGTTLIYLRGDDEATARIAQLRFGDQTKP